MPLKTKMLSGNLSFNFAHKQNPRPPGEQMQRFTIKMFGSVTYGASRSFIVDVPDDVNVATIDQKVIEALADTARVAWEIDAEGFLQTIDQSVEALTADEMSKLPVVPFTEAASSVAIPDEVAPA